MTVIIDFRRIFFNNTAQIAEALLPALYCFNSIDRHYMKKIKSFLIISLFFVNGGLGQGSFSNKGIRYDGFEDTFFPELNGTFEKKIVAASDQQFQGYDKKTEAMFLANLNKITSVFEKCPLMNPPIGLQVEAVTFPSIKKTFQNKASKLEAMIEIYVYAYVADENGNPGKFPESADYLSIYVNNLSMLTGAPVLEDIYIQPERTADFYGYPVNQTGRGEKIVLTKIKHPFYVPVSREDFLKATIRYWQKKIEESKSEGSQAGADRTALEEINEGRAQRLKNFEAAYAVLKKADPSAAEELKRDFEQTEKQLQQEMDSNEDYSVSKRDVNAEGDKIILQNIKKLQEQLNTLSAKEKKEQAYYNSAQLEVNGSGLVSSNQPGAQALIRINHQLLDTTCSKSDIQLIILDWHGFDPKSYEGSKKGFDLQKWFLAQLFKRDDVWEPIIQMLSN